MRVLASICALGLAAWAGAAAAGSAAPRVVPCSQVINGLKTGRENSYRVVLGVVSAPPARLGRVVRVSTRPWSYWTKAGLNIRAGRGPVRVTVPKAWRTRAAITWGNDTGIVSALRIARCPVEVPGMPWNGYAGGFYLRSRSACVPLVFSVGRRSATVRFGIGRRCAGAAS
jgi:hypothetical protein